MLFERPPVRTVVSRISFGANMLDLELSENAADLETKACVSREYLKRRLSRVCSGSNPSLLVL